MILLVNKEWCNIIVPILWKKYSWDDESIKRYHNGLLYFLPSSSKNFLSDHNIEHPLKTLLKFPLFNYISFCMFPKFYYVGRITRFILEGYEDHDKRNLLEQEIYKLFVNQCKDI